MNKTLKQMIRDKGIKQLDIARHLEISESHVSLLLKGKRRMNIDQAWQIASLMDMTMDDVYTGLKSGVMPK